jgi:type II secretory pathway pseudopilin PulG
MAALLLVALIVVALLGVLAALVAAEARRSAREAAADAAEALQLLEDTWQRVGPTEPTEPSATPCQAEQPTQVLRAIPPLSRYTAGGHAGPPAVADFRTQRIRIADTARGPWENAR